ncbi:winged helix DNA-binding domain-containing protein [Actinorugispora endophytica]|nr:winged helix DNA-binding domain-containing protein [Actinorugispora endophytica]
MGNHTVLGRRALNRATLDRQLLLRRSGLSVPRALEHLVGLQAQTPHTWYIGLWSRLADYDPHATGRLLTDRGAVRTALMRSTIHMVTAADALRLRPVLGPVIERGLTGPDLGALAEAGRALVEERPLTFKELGRALAERWPDGDPAAMTQAVRALVPLAQVPPRGVWGRSGSVAHTSVEAWLGRPVDAAATREELVLRYLAAFGPATVRDAQTWSGLTRLAEVFDGLRPRLAVFRDEDGRELFDLPDAPRPDPDTPAPARFLYDFDNLLRSHADRRRVMTVDFADQGFEIRNGQPPHAVLVDGVVAATWKAAAARGTAALTVRPFRALTTAEKEELHAEGARLLAFLEPGAGTRDVVFETPRPG